MFVPSAVFLIPLSLFENIVHYITLHCNAMYSWSVHNAVQDLHCDCGEKMLNDIQYLTKKKSRL